MPQEMPSCGCLAVSFLPTLLALAATARVVLNIGDAWLGALSGSQRR